GGARLHLLGLRFRALDRRAGIGHLAAEPGRRLVDPNLRLGGRVLRLHHFLLGAERLDPRGEFLLVLDEPLLLVFELLDLPVEALQLLLDAGLPLESLPREVLAAARERLARLGVELDDALLERGLLHLETLLRGDDVRDSALDVLEERQLLLVRVVERLGRILGAVQCLRYLRPEDHLESLPQARHRPSSRGYPSSLAPNARRSQHASVKAACLLAALLFVPAAQATPSGAGGAGAPPATITPAPAFAPLDLVRPAGADWATNGGDYGQTRYSSLNEITTHNVRRLTPKWHIHLNGSGTGSK